jgi:hypothetical protein
VYSKHFARNDEPLRSKLRLVSTGRNIFRISYSRLSIIMSSALSDTATGLYSTRGFTVIAVGLFVLFYLSSMKMCFGTYFIRTALRNYSTNKGVQKRYYEMFATRDNLMYHVSWAKTRGEMDEARSLMKQLEKIDKVSLGAMIVRNR